MLFGRFFLIIPTLALAGSVVRKRKVPATAGTFPTHTPLFVVARRRRRRDRRRPRLPARPRARPHRRAAEDLIEEHHQMARDTKLVEPAIVRRAVVDSFVKLNPRTLMRNPVMFVVGVGSVLTTILFFKDLGSSSTNQNVFTVPRRAVPVVHGAVRELRRGDRRGPGQGPGRHAAQDPLGDGRPQRLPDGSISRTAEHRPRPRRRVRRERGRGDPERRRGDRGHRERRRVGDHRRVGAGHPRVRWRPLGGHRRHPGALGRDRRADHRPSRARRSSTG